MFNYFLAQVNTVVSSGDAAASTTTNTAAASGGGMSMDFHLYHSYFRRYVFHFYQTTEKETERNGRNEK